jgi:hypothetical protein
MSLIFTFTMGFLLGLESIVIKAEVVNHFSGMNLHLEKFGLNWDSVEVSLCERPSLVQVFRILIHQNA